MKPTKETTRDKNKKNKTTSFSDYEHNLKLHYEAKRKDLDIITSSSIPTQFSIIKTLIWINLVMFGLTATFFKDEIRQELGLFQVLIFTDLSIMLIGAFFGIFALLIRNRPIYGSIYEQSIMYHIQDGIDAKSTALLGYIRHVTLAIRYNILLLSKRARYMRVSTITTATATALILLLIILLNYTKGDEKWRINQNTKKSQSSLQNKAVPKVRYQKHSLQKQPSPSPKKTNV